MEIYKPEKEKEIIPSQDQRMEFSDKLLERPIERGEPGFDRIFFTGRVSREGNIWRVDVEKGMPTVALNEQIRNEFDLKNSPIVNEMRARKKLPELSLISGGSFLWIVEKGVPRLILLRRDDEAPVDAGCLTGPAGRCSEKPSETAVSETNEELIIIKSRLNTGRIHYKLLGFFRDERMREAIIHEKLRQVEFIHNKLIERGKNEDAKILRLIRGEDDVEMLNMEEYKKDGNSIEQIITAIDGREIDRIRNGAVLFDAENNTLEIREILEVKLPEGSGLVKVLDGEPFLREVSLLKSIRELEGERMVPSLGDYYRKLKQKS